MPRVFDDTQANPRDIVKEAIVDGSVLIFGQRPGSRALESRGARLSRSRDRYSPSDDEPEGGVLLWSFTASSLPEAIGYPKHCPAHRAPIRGAKAFHTVPSKCNSPRARWRSRLLEVALSAPSSQLPAADRIGLHTPQGLPESPSLSRKAA